MGVFSVVIPFAFCHLSQTQLFFQKLSFSSYQDELLHVKLAFWSLCSTKQGLDLSWF